MSSAPFCRTDAARPSHDARTDLHAMRLVGRLIAGAHPVPPPDPELDRLCGALGARRAQR